MDLVRTSEGTSAHAHGGFVAHTGEFRESARGANAVLVVLRKVLRGSARSPQSQSVCIAGR